MSIRVIDGVRAVNLQRPAAELSEGKAGVVVVTIEGEKPVEQRLAVVSVE